MAIPRFQRLARLARLRPVRRFLGLRGRAIGGPLRRAIREARQGPWARASDELVDRTRRLVGLRRVRRGALPRRRTVSLAGRRAASALQQLRAGRRSTRTLTRATPRRRRGGFGVTAAALGLGAGATTAKAQR